MIERMEKFFLCTFFADNELYVIDQKYVIIAVLIAECIHRQIVAGLSVADRRDQIIGKCLTCHIQDFLRWFPVQYVVCDRMHQMGLAKSYPTI